jgi:hypothetical protein
VLFQKDDRYTFFKIFEKNKQKKKKRLLEKNANLRIEDALDEHALHKAAINNQ